MELSGFYNVLKKVIIFRGGNAKENYRDVIMY